MSSSEPKNSLDTKWPNANEFVYLNLHYTYLSILGSEDFMRQMCIDHSVHNRLE